MSKYEFLLPSFNPRTYRGEGISLSFSLQTIQHKHLTFSVAVRLSHARILRQVQWWSVSMVTRYDIISTRWSSHFWEKWNACFLSFFNKKVKIVDKMKQNANFNMCYFTYQVQKVINISCGFKLISNSPAVPPPTTYTSSSGFPAKGKIVLKYCNMSKTQERGSIKPSPPTCTTVGVWICVYVRGLTPLTR